MLFELLSTYAGEISILNVFRYITVRSALAGATSFLLCLMLGSRVIALLRRLSIGQTIREEGPQSHQKKAGTPTMGGILIIGSVVVATLIWSNLSNTFIWLQLFAMVGFAGVGMIDDLAKIMKKHNLGLTARGKILALLVVAGATAGWMYYLSQQTYQGDPMFITELYFPFFKEFHPNLLWGFIPFAIIVLLGSSNAVNLTDGLDGLAIGACGVAFSCYTLIAYVTSHAEMAAYLDIPHLLATGELTVFGSAVAGACIGFLWYNAHPAEVFMGDTGALGLGGALGAMALLTGHPLLLVIVGGLFVLEAGSVILQVASFKLRGKRIFRMAPIHHHFELKGWHESKVIIRFWILSILFAILALSTFKLR